MNEISSPKTVKSMQKRNKANNIIISVHIKPTTVAS